MDNPRAESSDIACVGHPDNSDTLATYIPNIRPTGKNQKNGRQHTIGIANRQDRSPA